MNPVNPDAAKAFMRQQAKKVSDYFRPTENVRVRDFVREVPGAVGQLFSGTRDTFVKGGKILGEGAAYALDRNVRDQYKAGNLDILPTISNATPRQMLANTVKAGMEVAPVGKIKGLASMAMNARLAPRLAAGSGMGYGYGVADEMSKPGPISRDSFLGVNPVMSALAGALLGGAAKPTATMVGQSMREMGNDVRNINPKNRIRKEIVPTTAWNHKLDTNGLYRGNPNANKYTVKTTVDPYNPQSYLARVLMGKQSPVGNTIQAVDDPLLQEARKYTSAEEFDYLYHSAFPKDLESIAKTGLKIQEGRKGVYLDQTVKGGSKWGNEGAPLLRVAKKFVPNAKEDSGAYGSFISNKDIPAEVLQISKDGGKTWNQLTDLWKKAHKK